MSCFIVGVFLLATLGAIVALPASAANESADRSSSPIPYLLTDAIQDDIDADMQTVRTKLLEELDQDVVVRLKDRQGTLVDTLNDFTRRLTMIARAEPRLLKKSPVA